MIVTHLFQVLGFVAMEPPTSFSPKALVDETVKVFEAMAPLRPEDVLRGQYAGYRAEPGVAPDSQTETFVALRVAIDNWRWAGVPFYLRTGKRMAESRRVMTITFRDPPQRMFELDSDPGPNQVVFDLGDRGGISANFLAKVHGPTMRLGRARFRFDYDDSFAAAHELEAYERLIHDALIGDRTLFTRADGIERLWELSAPMLAAPRRSGSTTPARGVHPGPTSSSRRAAGTCRTTPDRADRSVMSVTGRPSGAGHAVTASPTRARWRRAARTIGARSARWRPTLMNGPCASWSYLRARAAKSSMLRGSPRFVMRPARAMAMTSANMSFIARAGRTSTRRRASSSPALAKECMTPGGTSMTSPGPVVSV
jgi:hypothetical protein